MENIFYWTAIISSTLFVLKLISAITVGDMDVDVDVHVDADDSFFHFSVQSFLAFTMVFGWCGLAMMNDYQEAVGPSLGVAVLGGLVGVWTNRLVFNAFAYFNSPSITEEPAPEIGSRGVVYTRVSPDNPGLVYTSFRSQRRYYSAKSLTNVIESFKIVEITAVNGDLLTVKEI